MVRFRDIVFDVHDLCIARGEALAMYWMESDVLLYMYNMDDPCGQAIESGPVLENSEFVGLCYVEGGLRWMALAWMPLGWSLIAYGRIPMDMHDSVQFRSAALRPH